MDMTTTHKPDAVSHPCFNKDSAHNHSRVHLPVAPKCNIQCNYCNRKFDCVNESRPGVTSGVLTPFQALEYLKDLDRRLENLSVVGIAGPGDPFANPDETLSTIEMIRKHFPNKLLCLSSNGLNIAPYISELKRLDVTHVTITMNAIDPAIGKNIYSWIRTGPHIYRGEEAAALLLEKQTHAIARLRENRITVKINSIILPGINDHHFADIASYVRNLGANIMNCIPVYPNKDTAFEKMEKPGAAIIKTAREDAAKHMSLMTHCARCRADAAGLLGADYQPAMQMIREYARLHPKADESRPYVAVTTNEGMLVNLHLGEAERMVIFKQTKNGYQVVEERATPQSGSGDSRWMELASVLKDCRALLVSGIGQNPLRILGNSGIRIIQMTGLIDEGLEAIYHDREIRTVSKSELTKCGSACKGNARGCA